MIHNSQIDTKKFNEFYDKISHEIGLLESDLFHLEKEFFSVTPAFDILFNRLEKIQKISMENNATLLNYRIKNLHNELRHFHKNSGYNLNAFHEIFRNLHLLKNKLPDEIFSGPALQLIREKVKMEASKWIAEGLPGKSPLRKFLALENDNSYYVIPFKKKLWEKRVKNKKKIRIQIKAMPGENTFSFRCLPGNDESRTREKTAILLESEKDIKFGILADVVEGVMIFSEKFLKKKTDYFPIGEGNFTRCLNLRGKRYFIRDDFEKLV